MGFQEVVESDRDFLRHLMSTHGVLVFPGQDLTPAEELAVNRCFDYHDHDETGLLLRSSKFELP